MAHIDRDKLLKDISESVIFSGRSGIPSAEVRGANKVIDRIKSAPAADVVEVKHGEWIYHDCVSSYDGAISGFSCSVCSAFVNEEVFGTDEFHKKHCGNCGAKMDGERRETNAE